MPSSIHNKEDGSVSAEQLLHEAGFSARCPWWVGVCASYILSSFTLRWNYTQQAERKTSMLNEKANVGVSENSVPLNPMVLLIIIPTKWL